MNKLLTAAAVLLFSVSASYADEIIDAQRKVLEAAVTKYCADYMQNGKLVKDNMPTGMIEECLEATKKRDDFNQQYGK